MDCQMRKAERKSTIDTEILYYWPLLKFGRVVCNISVNWQLKTQTDAVDI